MRIVEIKVTNYRVHEELKVTLDAHRNVIIGPNESGKSTLMEAIHRVLFLKARGYRKEHQAMQSTTHSGKPEVALTFEADGECYMLKKSYTGQSGKSQLTQVGGKTWQGEEAEERLRELLGAAAEKPVNAWSHIFVYQGDSDRDPTEFANEFRADLVARFQASGGAVIQESAKDAEVAAQIAAERDELFTKAGAPRAGSTLAKATEEFEAAEARLEKARHDFAARESAVKTYLSASETIDACKSEISSLQNEKEQIDERVVKIKALEEQVKAARQQSDDIGKGMDQLITNNDKIAKARKDGESAKAALQPIAARVETAKESFAARKQSRSELDKAWRNAGDLAKERRAVSDLATRYRDLKQAEKDQSELQQRQALVENLRKQIEQIRKSNAEFPEVSAEQVEELNQLELKVNQTEAAVNAIATKVRVIESDKPILVDGVDVPVGEERTFTDEASITIGDGVQLAVVPGGGTSLTQARKAHTDAMQTRDALLESLGVASSAAAAAAQSKRQTNTDQLANLEAQLEQQGADELEEKLASIADRLTAHNARLQQQLAAKPDYEAPGSLEAAEQTLEAAEAARDEAVTTEEAARAALDELDDAIDEAESALKESEAEHIKAKQDLASFNHRLETLIDELGDDDQREKALVALEKEQDAQVETLDQLGKQLAEFEPEMVTQDLERVERAIKQKQSQLEEANATMNQSRGALGSDGTEDPESDVAMAAAQVARAQERRNSAKRYGDAIERLHELFTTKQQELADAYTRPLLDKASEYLRPVLGPTTQLRVQLEGTKFSGLELYREQAGAGAFEFETLSGGTREQVAAALRLAIAEVLAEDHDGCLPVVFDDSFTNSDPERTRNLQRMLDLAASRGLQVIALTCNPTDYSGFGATEIRLH